MRPQLIIPGPRRFFARAASSTSGGGALTALDFPGTGQNVTSDGSNTIKFGWLSSANWTGEPAGGTTSAVGPPAPYPLTVVAKAYPKDYGANASQYFTIFFWGNRGTFTWSAGAGKCYYGAHPFPKDGGPNTTGQYWELAVDGSDLSNGQAAGNLVAVPPQWNTVVSRTRFASSQYQHEVYFDYSRAGLSSEMHYNADSAYGATLPPKPWFGFGDAPWPFINRAGTFADPDTGEGAEIFYGGLRGFQVYTAYLSDSQLAAVANLDTNEPVLAACAAQGITSSLWYLNMNPTPGDIADKSGNGNHPGWIGPNRPALQVL